MWFLSGIAMIYAKAMPELTPESRLEHLPPLDFQRFISGLPKQRNARRLSGPAPRVSLLTIMGRPAYRFSFPDIITVFADTGEVMNPPGSAESLTIASHFLNLPESALHHVRVSGFAGSVDDRQRSLMPMHKISADDAAHTELYVSEESGEVAVVTTRGSRALAWVSAIPHWLYLTVLRSNGRVWTRGRSVDVGTGNSSGVDGYRSCRHSVFAQPPHIRYAGWMRWHYITGAIFGVFTLTWVFSGFLSMEPWDWASEGGLGDGMRAAFSGGPLDLAQFPRECLMGSAVSRRTT